MMEKLLAGRTVLLTGASGLVGRGIAHVLAQHGANIYCCDIDQRKQDELVHALRAYDVSAGSLIMDISQPSHVDRLYAAIAKVDPGVDVLIHCAGLQAPRCAFPNQDAGAWNAMLQTNVVGALYLTKRVCEGMIERAMRGSVIFITSIHQWTLWGEVGYSACKAALGAAVRELAFDLAAHGIRVNGIAPGAVGGDSEGDAVSHPPTPLHHEMVSPGAIGRAAVFLASDYFSRHITGTILTVDGGLSLHSYLSRE
jgi:NAD(P)-dependent dehydrogenase (short-subunit alcohol dehydrogenase family)